MQKTTRGWIHGFIGMIIFSGSLPATRIAIASFDPVFLTMTRGVIAGLLSAVLLMIWSKQYPNRQQWRSLVMVAVGVVIGFPLLTALALQYATAAHSLIFIGLLPLSTAIFGTWLGGYRPHKGFWVFAGIGSAVIISFSLSQGFTQAPTGDLLMVSAIILCGLGYAKGGTLSRMLGGWQVICWALVLSLPFTIAVMLWLMPASVANVSTQAWLSLAYVSLFSMLIGFVFWYRGLAEGGIAGVGQLQLLQPFFGLLLAAALLHEDVKWSMLLCAGAIVVCVAGAKHFAR